MASENKHPVVIGNDGKAYFDVFVWLDFFRPKGCFLMVFYHGRIVENENITSNKNNSWKVLQPLFRGCWLV